LIVVFTTKLLGVAAQRISALRNTRRHNRSPIPAAEGADTVQPVNEVGVQSVDKNSEDSQDRVLGIGPRVAAIRVRRVALVGRCRARGWRGIIVVAPSHWSSGGGDAAHCNKSHDERNEKFVEGRCEDEW